MTDQIITEERVERIEESAATLAECARQLREAMRQGGAGNQRTSDLTRTAERAGHTAEQTALDMWYEAQLELFGMEKRMLDFKEAFMRDESPAVTKLGPDAVPEIA